MDSMKCCTGGPIMFGYARALPLGRFGGWASIDRQRDQLAAAGVDPANIYADVCNDTREPKPGFDELMESVCEGDTVVVWSLEQLGHSPQRLTSIVDDLDAKGVGLIVLADLIYTTPPRKAGRPSCARGSSSPTRSANVAGPPMAASPLANRTGRRAGSQSRCATGVIGCGSGCASVQVAGGMREEIAE